MQKLNQFYAKRKEYLILYKDDNECCDFKFRLNKQEIRQYLVYLMKNFSISLKDVYSLYKECLKTKELYISDTLLFQGAKEVIEKLAYDTYIIDMRELAFNGFLKYCIERKKINDT